jgi:hypothetical protein
MYLMQIHSVTVFVTSTLPVCKAVFRIHDISVWIRICGSMPLTGNGSGSEDPNLDSDLDLAIFVIDLQDANKILFKKKVFCLLLFEGTFT